MIDLYTYMYEWNELYEQLEALVHVQVNIEDSSKFTLVGLFSRLIGTPCQTLNQ